ncbi:ABC transporter substrate-binding protein [Ammoniphilus sp. YIM 78166]|uniref:ABC transporter substrate-binding protein n=1 Tax=Ammoniphilus sp. YIM 78166 TaxID=1644106 RepID=UPI00106F7512|nr:helical backbone metal receptor [Ammoniphilus sp. YIM 78166]
MTNVYVDHVGRELLIPSVPQRIISLCPSITETLYALGLGSSMVGRTQFCIHPAEQVASCTKVGGTKQVKREIIEQLKPDLIIAEKEENPKDMVEDLARDFPVYVVNVETYEQALQMIRDLGQVTGRSTDGDRLATTIDQAFQQIQKGAARVGYLIWRKPYMAAGQSTYIDAMLSYCGFENVFKELDGRYPIVEWEQIQENAPEVLLLSSEPFPFEETHQRELEERLPGLKTMLVDGELFSWYGVRMLYAVDYFQKLINLLRVREP